MKKSGKVKICLFLLVFCMTDICCLVSVLADSEHSEVASGNETIAASNVEKYGMVPIYGRDVEDGVYSIEVQSSSSFFRIIDARLFVENGNMEAELVLSSGSYLLVYMGMGKEAAKADYTDYIEFEEDGGSHIVTVPVEALNKGIDCAAFSRNRKKWYDRKILFEAASLPEDALHITLPDYDLIEEAVENYAPEALVKTEEQEVGQDGSALASQAAVPVDFPDGEYSIEVGMTGGSGRANVSSPTLLIVEEGKAYARLLWSSPNYDYMIVDGATYRNETTDGGNSTFVIPITAMDSTIPVIADTTAMGEPVAIAYSLTFYRETIGAKRLIPQEAAKSVLVVAAVILVGGFVLNCRVQKKRGE